MLRVRLAFAALMIGLLALSGCRSSGSAWPPSSARLPSSARCFDVLYDPDRAPLLPARIALVELSVAADSGQAVWRPAAADSIGYGAMFYGAWRWLGQGRDSVVVNFTNGFSGASLVLGAESGGSGDGVVLFAGRAQTFSDVISDTPPPTSRVTVQLVPCSESATGAS